MFCTPRPTESKTTIARTSVDHLWPAMALANINLIVLFAFAWLIFALRYVWWRLFSYQGIPKHLPWAGSNGGLFSRARASCKSFFGLRELLLAGYREVT
jgi:hypothetical protein